MREIDGLSAVSRELELLIPGNTEREDGRTITEQFTAKVIVRTIDLDIATNQQLQLCGLQIRTTSPSLQGCGRQLVLGSFRSHVLD